MRNNLLILLLSNMLFSQNNLNIKGEEYLNEIRTVTGDITRNSIDGNVVDDRRGGNFDDFLDTVIWNDTNMKKTDKKNQVQGEGVATPSIPLDSPVDKLKSEWEAEEARLASLRAAEANKTQEIPRVFAGGYCTVDKQVSLSKSNEFSKFDCFLNFGRNQYKRVEVFASLFPDYKREIVIAVPIYAEFRTGERATFSGVVLKEDKISMNIAGWVDNMRIQKLIGEGLLATNDTVFNYVNGYMQALQLSRRQTGVEYITTTNALGINTTTPVQTTTIAPPEVKDYVLGAGIEILSNLFAIKGKDYLYSKKPLFEVYPQKVYIEGVISYDNAGLAQRFGKISESEIKKSNNNSKEWTKEKEKIIQQYNRRYKSTIPVSR